VRKNLNNDQPRVYFKSEKGKMKANSLKNNEDSLDNTWKWWLTEKRSKTSFFV